MLFTLPLNTTDVNGVLERWKSLELTKNLVLYDHARLCVQGPSRNMIIHLFYHR